jgi:hypothetical protein
MNKFLSFMAAAALGLDREMRAAVFADGGSGPGVLNQFSPLSPLLSYQPTSTRG